ncbi:MAG TPA: hypothetical protein VFA21_20905 [Pyrinomonadaceae bacterium]|nr:hypothetical protein [Pyrinomonadaceae bacterium]
MEGLQYKFTLTAAPVEAEGTIGGHPFYFRARHERWTFSVSEDADVDPVDIDSPEEGAAHGFFAAEKYGRSKSSAASYMPLDEAERIIERCAESYLHAKSEREI